MTDSDTPTTVIELPHLDANQALSLVAVLERICTALWRAHGRQMSEILIDHSARLDHASIDDLLVDFDDSDLPF